MNAFRFTEYIMELRQARQFVALAEALNFHRAAEALGMSQPPLSISMRKLEQELGVALFVRQSRGVTLTEAGHAALPHARRVLGNVEAMRDAIRATTDGMGGRLSVGFVGSAIYALLPKVVPLFRSQRPAVDLRLREATTLEILNGLESGDLDIGVLRTPVLDAGDVALEPLMREEMILLIPRNHSLHGQDRLRLEDLRDEPFIGYDRARLPNYCHLSLSACDSAGFQPRIAEEAAHLHTLIALVESGIGIALAPSVARIPGASRVGYARITVRGAPIVIGLALATRRDDTRPSRDAFVSALRGAAAELAEGETVLTGEMLR
ncbi:LysR family transcriptional regulator [Sphingomonas canadensis]|uniref:LysR family transcriptional regulator n=1 Tax=Sphingomonas canadensis TaxID=1219257 RepID=A0ABW3H293_9SPHN|nr:LysR family transcriptional regulator [Sphingomonas canadensis]MCW3834489.1 LysR family transcriptional regulator [Sphingomonas canadensis]